MIWSLFSYDRVFLCSSSRDHQSRIAGSGTWLTLSPRVIGSKKKRSTWLTLSQRVMGSKREAKYLAYLVTKSNGFEKGSEVLGLLCHEE